MHCGDQYPDKPPTIQFISEVNLPCVNQRNGVVSIPEYFCRANNAVQIIKSGRLRDTQVDPTKLPCLANWSRDNTMETVLIELRRFVLPLKLLSLREL
jgi:ubiquitin-conjugating enzyme E2 variant